MLASRFRLSDSVRLLQLITAYRSPWCLTKHSMIRRSFYISPLSFDSSNPKPPPHTSSNNNDKSNTHSTVPGQQLYETVSDVSLSVLRKLRLRERNMNVKTILIGSGILVVIVTGILYLFRHPIKKTTISQVADVAKRSLETEDVQQQVNQLSQEVVNKLLIDPHILSKTVLFLEKIIQDENTKQTLIRLLQHLMIDKTMQKYVTEFTANIVLEIMAKPETEIQLGELLRRAILQQDNKDALFILLKKLIEDTDTKQLLTDLAIQISHNVLNDENIKIAATVFVKEILNQSSLQHEAGDALWNAVKYTLKPKWFTTKANSKSVIVYHPTNDHDITRPSTISTVHDKIETKNSTENEEAKSTSADAILLHPVILNIHPQST
ncbi:unnamed protein product [Didymodactylos carnosus]|uniref:Uncharacterized protein n=2 Tax=Didymodactylos carnosus TaxID=1234261 RepID=A0A813WYI5_9BILA|nr:unnamed protein product [Didymodactylos carnosus]CAF3650050.1 unnamed protein product [Didymodactylos carnosus]